MQRVFITSRQPGFTLLELLITAAIILIVTAGALVAFFGFQERQQALIATKRVQQLMRSAQTKARARETPDTCNVLHGYLVSWDMTAFSMQALCENGVQGVVRQASYEGNQLVIDGGVSSPIVFRALEGGVTTNDATPIPISESRFTFGTGVTYNFSITPTGVISNVTSSAGSIDL